MTISAQKPEIIKNNDFPNFPEIYFAVRKKENLENFIFQNSNTGAGGRTGKR